MKRSYLEKIYFKKRTYHSLKAYKKQKNYSSRLYKKERENDQEIANELKTFFKDTVSNSEIKEIPYIINQVLDDILDRVEKCINKHQFHPSILFIKNRIKIQNLFSFHAIERNDLMRKLLNIDPKKTTTGSTIQNFETKC